MLICRLGVTYKPLSCKVCSGVCLSGACAVLPKSPAIPRSCCCFSLGTTPKMSTVDETPAKQEYRMPAEWARHSQTWMGWPQRQDNWRDRAGPAQKAFAEVATAISHMESVIVCANADQVQNARQHLPETVQVQQLPQDDAWFRDTGPSFVVKSGSLAGVDWIFNGWGGKLLDGWEMDDKVASAVLALASVPKFRAAFVLEGGSIHVDGEGTLLTTRECLLNGNRNPQLSEKLIEEGLKAFTGSTKVIWLPYGLAADIDTDGHVDNLACFAAPSVVLLAWPSVEDPEQMRRSEAALQVLQSSTDAQGRHLTVIKLPLPPPLHREPHEEVIHDASGLLVRRAGERLAASYINFYICNGGVIVPAFGGAAANADARAQQILQEVFPDRKIVAISGAREILLGGGNIHCITQQQPTIT